MKNTKKILSIVIVFSIMFIMNISTNNIDTYAKTYKTYTISETSKPIDKQMLKFGIYNTKTRQYYAARSYLEKIEKDGGGTLIFKKGTYTITNTLYVPKNTTIILNDGVKIVKGNNTGTKIMKPANSIFQLIKPSYSEKKGAYGKYNGEKNIKFIGKGNATIDLNYYKDSIAIIFGHNKNVTIDNIDFKNMYSGHFIELTAASDVTIKNCSFTTAKASPKKNKEAINIDTPDKVTQGYSQIWSKYDKTPCTNITITNNYFYNLDRAIGTHKYSEEKLHSNINIDGNTIDTTRQDSIRVMNWLDSTIENNSITNVNLEGNKLRGILVSGSDNLAIKNNNFSKSARAIQYIPWKNSGPGDEYDIIYDNVTDENKNDLKTNTTTQVFENFVRINSIYNEYINGTEKIYFD